MIVLTGFAIELGIRYVTALSSHVTTCSRHLSSSRSRRSTVLARRELAVIRRSYHLCVLTSSLMQSPQPPSTTATESATCQRVYSDASLDLASSPPTVMNFSGVVTKSTIFCTGRRKPFEEMGTEVDAGLYYFEPQL